MTTAQALAPEETDDSLSSDHLPSSHLVTEGRVLAERLYILISQGRKEDEENKA